jgi:methyl-accepting chemotaxis protein
MAALVVFLLVGIHAPLGHAMPRTQNSGQALGALMYAQRWVAHRLGGEPDAVIAVVNSIAAGDLVPRVNGVRQHSVMDALGQMVEKFSKAVSQVRTGAEGVASASTEIAQGNNDLSSRTEQQASALQETAASMEQLASTVRQNAE